MILDLISHGDGNLYIGIHSLWFKVEGMFTTAMDTNIFLETNPDCGVILDGGGTIIVARNADDGLKELPKLRYNLYGEVV